MAPLRLVLHRLSCSNETPRNALKHEFSVQWSASGAFVTKDSKATYRLSCTNETVRNVLKHEFCVQWSGRLRSLRKILTRLCLAHLCVDGTNSASFASTFVQYRNGSKRTKT
jgi:hypothetical protein